MGVGRQVTCCARGVQKHVFRLPMGLLPPSTQHCSWERASADCILPGTVGTARSWAFTPRLRRGLLAEPQASPLCVLIPPRPRVPAGSRGCTPLARAAGLQDPHSESGIHSDPKLVSWVLSSLGLGSSGRPWTQSILWGKRNSSQDCPEPGRPARDRPQDGDGLDLVNPWTYAHPSMPHIFLYKPGSVFSPLETIFGISVCWLPSVGLTETNSFLVSPPVVSLSLDFFGDERRTLVGVGLPAPAGCPCTPACSSISCHGHSGVLAFASAQGDSLVLSLVSTTALLHPHRHVPYHPSGSHQGS